MKVVIKSDTFYGRLKLNWNCPESEKVDHGPGSCSGTNAKSYVSKEYTNRVTEMHGILPENEMGPQARIRNKETNSQEELILGRNQKFRVIGVKQSGKTKRLIVESI